MPHTASPITNEQVARQLGYGLWELQETAAGIKKHYRREDRQIGEKLRNLLIPSEHLKAVQRAILENILYRQLPHPAVFCRPGRGVLDAVRRHRGHRYVLHLDLKNFFPSVRPSRVRRAFRRLKFDPASANLLTRLTTFENHLPQGAPTSVAVANLVLERLDRSLWGLCKPFGLTYTRYVDDIAVSGGEQVQSAESRVRKIITDCRWDLSDKGGLIGPGERARLLGVRLGATLNVDPSYVADLETLLESKSAGGQELSAEERMAIEGKIAWIRSVNPEDALGSERLFAHLVKGR